MRGCSSPVLRVSSATPPAELNVVSAVFLGREIRGQTELSPVIATRWKTIWGHFRLSPHYCHVKQCGETMWGRKQCGDNNVGTDGTFTSFFRLSGVKELGYVPSVPGFSACAAGVAAQEVKLKRRNAGTDGTDPSYRTCSKTIWGHLRLSPHYSHSGNGAMQGGAARRSVPRPSKERDLGRLDDRLGVIWGQTGRSPFFRT